MDSSGIPALGSIFQSSPGQAGPLFEMTKTGRMVTVRRLTGAPLHLDLALTLEAAAPDPQVIALSRADEGCEADLAAALLAGIEAVLGWYPEPAAWRISLDGYPALADMLERSGAAVRTDQGLMVLPSMLMQQASLWLRPGAPFPQRQVMTGGKRHPQRAPKPRGIVYARFIPWLGQTISFRAATIEADLPHLHKWMNDPRVAAFWNEDGDLEKHRAYLAGLLADPHMVPLIGCFDGVPFSYFEIYWAKENRIAPFYDADDYDRGWHVVVGEDAYRGRQFIGAWLPSLMHYMFLDDPRTQRIVGEPAAAHHQQIRNLEKSGFAKLKNFDFPHKRATLVMLLRERFFEDRLWLPAGGALQVARPETAAPARLLAGVPA